MMVAFALGAAFGFCLAGLVAGLVLEVALR